jgi:hypothetical protein
MVATEPRHRVYSGHRYAGHAQTEKPTIPEASTPPMLQTTRTQYESHGNYYVLDGAEGIFGPVTVPHSGKRSSDDILTFANVIFTLVNNPGIFNLLNSGAGDAFASASNTTTQTSNTNAAHRDIMHYTPQAANVGFINGGFPVDDRPVEDKTTWAGISQMTYTKLRVGIMDQSNVHNSAQRYVNEVLNDTRHTSSVTVMKAFRSFMFKLYRKECFVASFNGYADRKKQHLRRHPPASDAHEAENLKAENMDVEYLGMCDQIEKDAEWLVAHLESCCKDSGLDATELSADNYAFPALLKAEIQMPKNMAHRLFYIIFGETICKMADDLSTAPVVSLNTPQTLQHRSNIMLAAHFRAHMPKFLHKITSLFFNGSLHSSLVRQLRKNRVHTKGPAPMRHLKSDPWSFTTISNCLQDALR